MEQLDTLLQLITHLQDDRDTARGQQLLLKYARTTSGARLVLLFRLDEKQQQLLLLAHDGRRPHHTSGQPSPENISLHGCFGIAVATHGLLFIPSLHADKRSLSEERYWTWPRGLVVACAIGRAGILVLCFAPQKPAIKHITNDIRDIRDTSLQFPTFDESNILICASLLASYLTTGHPPGAPQVSVRSARAARVRPLTGPTQAPPSPQDTAVIDRERERIARDIHDGPAQQITVVLHRLEYIQRILIRQPQEALREIGRARQTLDEGLRDLRQCITTLIPTQLQHQTLSEALHAYTQNDERLHIAVELDNLASVPPALEVPIYRFVQEALNNVRKHAQAQRAIVRIRNLPGLLLVEIHDDGKGFDSKTLPNHFTLKLQQRLGLRTMRDRVQETGGTWEINSTPGAGTTVRARFPLTIRATSTTFKALPTPLTNRERDVLRLVIDGLTNRAIAEQLTVSTETVKSHVHHIMQKMNAKDRTHAAVLATKQHWI